MRAIAFAILLAGAFITAALDKKGEDPNDIEATVLAAPAAATAICLAGGW